MRPMIGLATAAAVAVVLSVPTGQAQAAIIHACVHQSQGLIRIVLDPNVCNTQNEIALTWNSEGPPGPAGAGEGEFQWVALTARCSQEATLRCRWWEPSTASGPVFDLD
jgi:hypothetical protein